MRGVFGMLLIGGGIVLLIGEFASKITFPLGSSTATTGATSNGTTTGH